MSVIAFIRQMLDVGLDMAHAMKAAEAFEANAQQEHERLIASLLDRLEVDAKADERRRKDRERKKAKKAGIPQNSAESAESAEPVPLSLAPSPRTPQPHTHSPPDITTRTRALAKPNGFARFWEAYPNKVGKASAAKAYERALKLIDGPDPPAAILAGVERAKASRAWGEGYIPHPTTWLNRGSWDDEPAEVIPIKAPHERPDPADRKRTQLETNFSGFEIALGRRALERAGGS